MKKQEGLGLIGILLVIGILILTAGGVVVWNKKIVPTPTPTPVEIQPSLPDQKSEKIGAEVYQKLKEDGKVLIIVGLYGIGPPVTEEEDREELIRQRQNIEILETALATLAFTPEEFKLGYKWGELAGFSGAVYKQSALDKLENYPKVKAVTLDKPVPPAESPTTE